MKVENRRELKKNILLAAKIAVGSSLAIWIAELLGLQYASSAGTITLLTLMTTKQETVKLSVFRLISFVLTAVVAWLAFMHINSTWLSYGVFIFIVSLVLCILGWKATISINAVIGVQMLTQHDFSLDFVGNEFLLVLIGVLLALALNMFHDHSGHRRDILTHVRYTEERMQRIIGELAAYLSGKAQMSGVWDELCSLQKQMRAFLKESYEYKENSFRAHHSYFAAYFEMRMNQCQVLDNLHGELGRLRSMPGQAAVIAEYMEYLRPYVIERNIPAQQIERLEELSGHIRSQELPDNREDFEGHAILYHVLMDLEEFLMFKKRFVEQLDEQQLAEYWSTD